MTYISHPVFGVGKVLGIRGHLTDVAFMDGTPRTLRADIVDLTPCDPPAAIRCDTPQIRRAHAEALREHRRRFGDVLHAERPVFTNPTPFQVFLQKTYLGVGVLKGHRCRIFHLPGESQNASTMAAAEVVRDQFFPGDELTVEDGYALPVKTFYRIHNTLRLAGCRAIVDHVRGIGTQETHARPRPIREEDEEENAA